MLRLLLSCLMLISLAASPALAQKDIAPSGCVPDTIDLYIELQDPAERLEQIYESALYSAFDVASEGDLRRNPDLANLREGMKTLAPFLEGRVGMGFRSLKTFKFLFVAENPRKKSLKELLAALKKLKEDIEPGEFEDFKGATMVTVEGLGFLAQAGDHLIWSSDRYLLRRGLRKKAGKTMADRADWMALQGKARGSQIVGIGNLGRVARKLEGLQSPDNFLGVLLAGDFVDSLKTAKSAELWGRVDPVIDLQIDLASTEPLDESWARSGRRFHQNLSGPDTISVVRLDRDMGEFWRQRGELVPEAGMQELAEFAQGMNVFFSGLPFEDVLDRTRPGMELIAENIPHAGEEGPEIYLPGFALVLDTEFDDNYRDRFRVAFQTAVGIINADAGEQRRQPMLQFSRDVGDVEVLAARFLDDPRDGRSGIHYNITPSIAFVGSRLIVSTSVELTARLVGRLSAVPKPDAERLTGDSLLVHNRALVKALELNRQALIDQRLIEGAADEEEAATEIKGFLKIAEELGDLELQRRFAKTKTLWRLRLGAKPQQTKPQRPRTR